MPASKVQLAARLNATLFAPIARELAVVEAERRNIRGQLELTNEQLETLLPKFVTVAVTCKNVIVGMCATNMALWTSNPCYGVQIGAVLDEPGVSTTYSTRIMYSGYDKNLFYKALQQAGDVRALKFYNFQRQDDGSYKFYHVV
jgi:hypothetical protein